MMRLRYARRTYHENTIHRVNHHHSSIITHQSIIPSHSRKNAFTRRRHHIIIAPPSSSPTLSPRARRTDSSSIHRRSPRSPYRPVLLARRRATSSSHGGGRENRRALRAGARRDFSTGHDSSEVTRRVTTRQESLMHSLVRRSVGRSRVLSSTVRDFIKYRSMDARNRRRHSSSRRSDVRTLGRDDATGGSSRRRDGRRAFGSGAGVVGDVRDERART